MTSPVLVAACLTLGLVGCGGRGADPAPADGSNAGNGTAALGRDFTLRPGESLRLAGTRSTLTFVAVPEDSRCPEGVQCIWAGNAKLSLRLDEQPFAINSTVEPRDAVVQGYRFHLVGLTQRPIGDTVVTNYTATIRVETE